MQKEIKKLVKTFKSENEDSSVATKLKDSLDQAIKVFKYLEFEENLSQITPQKMLEMLNSSKSKDQLEASIIAQSVSKLNSSVNNLERIVKKISHLDNLNADKTKDLQKKCSECSQCIQEYLETQKQTSLLDFSFFKNTATEALKSFQDPPNETLQNSIPKISTVSNELSQTDSLNVEIVLEVKTLIDQLENFFKGKKGKKIASKYENPLNKLSECVKPYLKTILPLILEQLLQSFKACQKALYHTYVTKLKKLDGQLSLGIRQQTYYTTSNENITYYLWGGKKFDALPYHTDNEVHIPLVHNHDLSMTGRTHTEKNSLFENQENYLKNQQHVIRIRNFNSNRVRKRITSDT